MHNIRCTSALERASSPLTRVLDFWDLLALVALALCEERYFGRPLCLDAADSWGDLVVIDTPGVPSADLDPKTTVSYFDSIVEYVRKEGKLSTLAFLVHQDDGIGPSPNVLRKYRVLLEQFNHLPCSKLIVCRQPELGKKSKRAGENRNRSGKLIEQASDFRCKRWSFIYFSSKWCIHCVIFIQPSAPPDARYAVVKYMQRLLRCTFLEVFLDMIQVGRVARVPAGQCSVRRVN